MKIADVKLDHEYFGRTRWAHPHYRWRGLAKVKVTDLTPGYCDENNQWTAGPVHTRARIWLRCEHLHINEDGTTTWKPGIVNYRTLYEPRDIDEHRLTKQIEMAVRTHGYMVEREGFAELARYIVDVLGERGVTFEDPERIITAASRLEPEAWMLKGLYEARVFDIHFPNTGNRKEW